MQFHTIIFTCQASADQTGAAPPGAMNRSNFENHWHATEFIIAHELPVSLLLLQTESIGLQAPPHFKSLEMETVSGEYLATLLYLPYQIFWCSLSYAMAAISFTINI